MTDIYINPITGDLDLVNGAFRLCETKAELARQEIYIALNVNRGTWKFNINYGAPWLSNTYNQTQLLGKIPIGVLDGQIKNLILSQDYVTSISEYDSTLSPSTRQLIIDFKITTPEGPIEGTVESQL